MEKKWIIFDVMGVIFKVGDDTNDLLVPYVQQIDKNCSREKINNIYLEASLGSISSSEFWKKLHVADDDNFSEVEKRYLDNCLTIDEQFIDVAKQLKNNYNLAILSNDVSEWGKYLREKYGLNELVKFSIISGDVGYRKPSEEIYKIALIKANVSPENCVFIDDRDKNLIPAQKLGMKTIRFLRDDTECKIASTMTIESFINLEKTLCNVW